MRIAAPCESLTADGCPVQISIAGQITPATAEQFSALLASEQKRTGLAPQPVVTIQSSGGDIAAAMKIGRELRRRLGVISATGACHSACVLLALGAVERNLAGIGLHRPFFGQSDASTLADADRRYKRLIALVRDYLFDMNTPENILHMMLAVPPGELKLVSAVETRQLGVNGVDPAFEELKTAREARRYGITSAELRTREAKLDRVCGREEDMRSLAELHRRNECKTNQRERILWGLDEERFAAFRTSSAEMCTRLPPDTGERQTCVLSVASALRGDGQPD